MKPDATSPSPTDDTLANRLADLAWTLDAQGRKDDSVTCSKAALALSTASETAMPKRSESGESFLGENDYREALLEQQDYLRRLKHRADVRGGPDVSAMGIADEAIARIEDLLDGKASPSATPISEHRCTLCCMQIPDGAIINECRLANCPEIKVRDDIHGEKI